MFDILVMPSLWEAMPYTLLEAVTMGVPVIATAVGGIPEVADKNDRILPLIPPGDHCALAAAINSWKDNPEAVPEQKSKTPTNLAQCFKLETMISSLEKLYQEQVDE